MEPMNPIRVLIVDDHPVIRRGIHDLLAKGLNIEIIGETGDGSDALRMARELSPDVMLLDMHLQGMSGIDVAQTLQQEGSSVRVLAFSAYNDREYIQEILKSGASGYLNKDEGPELILAAVKGVAGGEKGWISRKIMAQLSDWQSDEVPTDPGMTPREIEVLNQLMEGKTNGEIAVSLTISDKTVEKHLSSIFHKLSVTSRTEAAVWAAREEITNRD